VAQRAWFTWPSESSQLRGTRPSTLRDWGVECDYTEFHTIDRHPTDSFQCLPQLSNPKINFA